MYAAIKAIEYYLPEQVLDNRQLAHEFPQWSAKKIEDKIGISERRIAAPNECASDLGIIAAQKLFSGGSCSPDDIDYLIFCTQSPDYFLPTTACVVQHKLGIPTHSGAVDINLGCSGFVYGLGLAKALIETDQARNILLITADTYSKFINGTDHNVRTLFGDGAAATLIQGLSEIQSPTIGPFVYGTDGNGANNLIVKNGGMRQGTRDPADPDSYLYMDGPEIFSFSLRVVPDAVSRLLSLAKMEPGQIDLFVFHQANKFMLEQLRRKLNIEKDKFIISMQHCGNTVSSTIPIALKQLIIEGKLHSNQLVMLVGFGVGYSWSSALIRWL